MGLLGRDLQMVKASCSSNDSLDIMLLHQGNISGRIEIAQDEFPCPILSICGQDDVIRFVLLLGIIIM